MRIAFYAPFKPLNHARISGDITIARDAMEFFVRKGHSTSVISPLESTWLYLRPWRWPDALLEYMLARSSCSSQGLNAWITYHSYYKAPDILGPRLARLGLPYFIFSGAYADKRKRSLKTLPGYILNKRALLAASHVFVNKLPELETCSRILPDEKLTYIKPGIFTHEFSPDILMRQKYRRAWGARETTVVVTAAMMRKGVKADGVEQVIRSCAELANNGKKILLIVAGGGPEKDRLERLAASLLPGKMRFLGRIPRQKLYRIFSAADLFAFPGYNEGLGMVYLEAQCSGLPCVATDDAGAPEVIRDMESGLIVPANEPESFTRAIETLVDDSELRTRLGHNAREYVVKNHDIEKCYAPMNTIMREIVENSPHSWSPRR
ncbi:glycosyltransferase family 4 protein [Desulfobaculum bizertense]|uniref:glycosyltransferase family 4 protein n=1 Tax=Desulfobaculum bizertense TaxID=376490 RepID=UPI001F2D5512|nr:glycosyltransferase family 4 protein [Desulfobaculum bizertense]UIJ39270.1 glycosyltransferase family 4 protein [Desulfobaculum bizertense]